jgi:hypothetical protein
MLWIGVQPTDSPLRLAGWTGERVATTTRLKRILGSLVGLAAASVMSTADAQTLDRRVRIVNESGRAIVGFYAVVVEKQEWPASLLGESTLAAGASVVLDFEDGSGFCRYRFRAVFDDGVELVRPSVNVCEVGTYRYMD